MTRRSDGVFTRQRILEVAAGIFANRGYREATIAEICREAAVNIASVNYHFGSKDELYVEAWRYVFDKSVELYPSDGGVPAEASASERFRGHIAAVVGRVLDPASLDFDIAHREMANPTGLLVKVMHESLEPLHRTMQSLIQELIGAEAGEVETELCCFSVMAQCMDCAHHKRKHMPPMPEEAKNPSMENLQTEEWIEHIYQFSLAGIERQRAACAARAGKKPKARKS